MRGETPSLRSSRTAAGSSIRCPTSVASRPASQSAAAVSGWPIPAGRAVLWINASAPGAPTPIQVGQGPGPIVYGLGAAWVADAVDGTLQRIDGARRAPSTPVTIGTSPAAIAIGDGSVWVTDTGSNSVVRVDPRASRSQTGWRSGTTRWRWPSAADACWVAQRGGRHGDQHRARRPTPRAPPRLAAGRSASRISTGLCGWRPTTRTASCRVDPANLERNLHRPRQPSSSNRG